MWQVPRQARVLIATLLAGLVSTPSLAEDIYYLNQSQSGFNLPGVSLPQGQDEVRAADGTTCRSAVGGSGAYLDVGAINGSNNRNGDVATYGRVVIPLGGGGRRVNCAELYDLEIARLRAELKLLQMGVTGGQSDAVATSTASAGPTAQEVRWADTGWTDGKQKSK
ncbi:hypothetical protein [Aureimonas sp. AU22]|uniref:hypothetical protein n=1 Tax=Aureimonas sp. AU22 TaxID=1638162 RepID=UPI00078377FC|nr:hypothetical protein [Aureimonas sp. AU22]